MDSDYDVTFGDFRKYLAYLRPRKIAPPIDSSGRPVIDESQFHVWWNSLSAAAGLRERWRRRILDPEGVLDDSQSNYRDVV